MGTILAVCQGEGMSPKVRELLLLGAQLSSELVYVDGTLSEEDKAEFNEIASDYAVSARVLSELPQEYSCVIPTSEVSAQETDLGKRVAVVGHGSLAVREIAKAVSSLVVEAEPELPILSSKEFILETLDFKFNNDRPYPKIPPKKLGSKGRSRR